MPVTGSTLLLPLAPGELAPVVLAKSQRTCGEYIEDGNAGLVVLTTSVAVARGEETPAMMAPRGLRPRLAPLPRGLPGPT